MAEEVASEPTDSALSEQLERCYQPQLTQPQKAGFAFATVACAILGAGVVAGRGQALLLSVGAAGFALGFWLWSKAEPAVRVGAAGVALDQQGTLTRLRWCDISKIRVTVSYLELHHEGSVHYVALAAQPVACARIVSEAAQRIMTRLELSRAAHDRLAKLDGDTAPQLRIGPLQVAGGRCTASGELLAMERDVRLCPRCTAAYHVDHVVDVCKVCEAAVGEKAWRI